MWLKSQRGSKGRPTSGGAATSSSARLVPRGFVLFVALAGAVVFALVESAELRADESVVRLIDDAIGARLNQEKVTPAPRADDATLLRRLHLDLLGRPPTRAEAEAFLADGDPDKSSRLIDALLVHPEMPVHWRKVVDGWLNGRLARDQRGVGHPEHLDFLERSLAANKPWDRLVGQLLLPDPNDADQQGATHFIASRLGRSKEENLDHFATSVAGGLFGVQMQCAKCHDHPFVTDWKQAHYYGIAAIFTRLERKPDGGLPFSERPDGELRYVAHDKQEKLAAAMFFDSVVLEEPVVEARGARDAQSAPQNRPTGPQISRRERLVRHALSPDSPFFKRSLVNRVWKQLLGRGLVEPVDQIHSANPASHPRLLDDLADDFAAHDFDLRRLLSGVLHSETYCRDSRFPGAVRPPAELYAAAALKPLSGDQVAWSLATTTGFSDQILLKWGKELKPAPEPGALNRALRVRWEKEAEYDAIVDKYAAAGESFQASPSQALFLTFNPSVLKMIRPGGDRPPAPNLADRMTAESDPVRRVELAYLAVLARRPTAEESAEDSRYFLDAADPRQAVVEFLGAMLNGAEFRFVP